jgi:hypothetical protein
MAGAPDQLIARLAGELRPVRRLAAPWLRAALWLAVVLAIGAGVGCVAGLRPLIARLAATADLRLAMAGAAVTSVLAAIAAFELSLPDRSPRWMLLPVPALLVWVAASGVGCLRDWIAPGTRMASMADARHCLFVIVAYSVPLSLLLIAMLRRARPLRPAPVAAMGGLAVAAAAATLLTLTHPFDSAATDLAAHLLAVLLVVMANGMAARVLEPR